jgi:O-antigen ligase
LISEEFINTIKWTIPGILVFDGCRTRRRLLMFLVCLFIMYLLIATQVVLRLPASSVFNPDGNINATRKACLDIGYGACDMSAMLAGVFWAILATLPLVRDRKYLAAVLAAAFMVMYGQALTGGRAGFVAWGVTGLAMCLLRWRKYLIFAPIIVILLPIIFPGAAQRMLMGFGQSDVSGEAMVNRETVTSDRTRIWPHVIDKIGESPLVGHGRLAMPRTDLAERVTSDIGAYTDQPHNMYLETLLDNGVLGSLPIFVFLAMMILYSAILFRSDNRLCSAVGGLAFALTLPQLVGGIGSQHVYPEISTMGMWMGMFLVLRVSVEEKNMQIGVTVA